MSIENLTSLVKPELESVNARILDACKNHVELIPTVSEHLIAAGGKRVRPILTLASAKLCDYSGERHINLAAAVEFMHTATLLHDDVVDDSSKRRGMDTANYIYGNKVSVLVGDYLLGKAFQMMVSDGSLEVLRILSDAAAKIAEGEVLQISLTHNLDTTLEQYIEVVQAKTAELFAAACEVGGAIIDDKKKQKALRDFGENFGIAFQIVDDALDYAADPEVLGKNIGDDFREGKVTLPIIYAYENSSGEDRAFWQKAVSGDYDLNEDDLLDAQDLVKSSGALEKAMNLAKTYADKAINSLEAFQDSALKQEMKNLVEYSIHRKF